MKEKNIGFPYEDSWCYIYNFSGKILQSHYSGIETNIGDFKNQDKHFCSEKCMMQFIKKVITEAKKEPKQEPINLEECSKMWKSIKWVPNDKHIQERK